MAQHPWGSCVHPRGAGALEQMQAKAFLFSRKEGEGGAAVTWDVGWAPPCTWLLPPPSTAAPLVAAPHFPPLH